MTFGRGGRGVKKSYPFKQPKEGVRMNRMNRREFLNVLSGVSAASMIGATAFASSSADRTAVDVTSMYVKGLVMVDLGNPEFIRIGFPKAPGHKATLSIVPQNGAKRTIAIKGNGQVEAPGIASADPKIFVPEIVRMKEFYGDAVRSHVDKCPSVISIPKTAIHSVTTSEVSPSRYTFVRADNGQEVNSFRPRQIAQTIKIDLSSAGTLKLDGGKVNIPLETAREMTVEYAPEKVDPGFDPYTDHFGHYFDYIEKPAALDFNVIPKKVSGGSISTPHAGNQFLDGYAICFVAAVP
jgi:hypothetical protein